MLGTGVLTVAAAALLGAVIAVDPPTPPVEVTPVVSPIPSWEPGPPVTKVPSPGDASQPQYVWVVTFFGPPDWD